MLFSDTSLFQSMARAKQLFCKGVPKELRILITENIRNTFKSPQLYLRKYPFHSARFSVLLRAVSLLSRPVRFCASSPLAT